MLVEIHGGILACQCFVTVTVLYEVSQHVNIEIDTFQFLCKVTSSKFWERQRKGDVGEGTSVNAIHNRTQLFLFHNIKSNYKDLNYGKIMIIW